jgi:glycosyltransferase involved in cell wall biosynthesis
LSDSTRHILLVTHFYAEHRGGIEIVARNLGEAMVEGGIGEITWCASDVNLPEGPFPEGLACVPMRTLNVVEDKLHVPYPLWGPGSLWKLWRASGNADVVHLHDFFYMGNVSAFVFAKLRGKPVVITQHIGFVPYQSALLRLILGTVNATLGKVLLSGADQVVYISETVLDYFQGRIRYRRPARFIPNGVDTEMYTPGSDEERSAVRKDFGIPQDSPMFLFVGRFVEKKGLHILEELVKRVPEATWCFAGWGPMDPEDWNADNVRVIKGRSGAELAEVYRAADLLVLPSVGEGFPLVIQEAMACGTPAFVSTTTAGAQAEARDLMIHEEVSEDGDTAGTVDAWAARLSTLIAEPDTLRSMRSDVSDFAHAQWSWRGNAERYGELFAELLDT